MIRMKQPLHAKNALADLQNVNPGPTMQLLDAARRLGEDAANYVTTFFPDQPSVPPDHITCRNQNRIDAKRIRERDMRYVSPGLTASSVKIVSSMPSSFSARTVRRPQRSMCSD